MKEVTKKVDAVLEKIETNDITTTNDLMYAGAAVVTDLVGVKRGNRQTRKEPWWKRRLENQVKMLNKDLVRVNVLIQQKTIKKKHKDTLQRRYKIQQKGLGMVKEEIKQRILAKTGIIKRFSNKINRYRENSLFQNNQHRFYQELNEEGQQQDNEAPDRGRQGDFGIYFVGID